MASIVPTRVAMSSSVAGIAYEVTVHLSRFLRTRHIPSMIWREIDNFSSASVCLVIASKTYDEADYIRDYRKFKATVQGTI
jgi:hypothetical protein